MFEHSQESFYDPPPPQRFFNEIAGVETSSRPDLRKCGGPCHLDVIVRQSFATKEMHEDTFSISSSFFVSSSRETSVEKYRRFWGRLS